MTEKPTQYVVVDWRPYDLPTVIGPFVSEEQAQEYYVWLHDLQDGEYRSPIDIFNDLDGIDVRPLEAVLPR